MGQRPARTIGLRPFWALL